MKKVILPLLILICALLVGCGKPDAATQKVIDQIDELQKKEYITLEELDQAKERYNSLSDDQKKKVSNYDKLMDMEDNYETLGKIPLTVENCSDYIEVGVDRQFINKKGRAESDGDAFGAMTVTIATRSTDASYEFDGVTVEIALTGEYYPLSKLSAGNYGLRAGTTTVSIDETIAVSCDETGSGTSEMKVISAEDSKYAEGAFGYKSFSLTDDLTISVKKITGTVLPKKE